MSDFDPSRRRFLGHVGLAGLGVLGAGSLVGCASSASSPGGSGSATGPITLQSNLSSPQAKAAMEKIIENFNKQGKGTATLNTIASETYRTQLPTYLTSANPPDLYTWYAGSVANDYASKNLLLDVSDVWQGMSDYPESLRTLSTDASGKKIFVPMNNYWWGFFYRKSNFAKWGVQEPKTWAEFITLCQTLQSKGIPPIGIGLGDTPWVASAWFDYLNIRINGAPFHRELLAGKQRFDDPKVKAVLEKWREVLPFFDPKGKAYPFQEATTALLAGKTGMFLIGTFFADAAPKDALGDLDFFRFPIIDPAVPVAEEAPTDGFFASAKAGNPTGTKALLTYLASAEAQEAYVAASSGIVLPANPKAKASDSPLVVKGKAMLDSAKELTQFFNRDSSDALQPTADTALTKFIDKPDQIDAILREWQAGAEKVFKG
ncbi:ABC transporter substrate-binding protein [Micromonospora sp. NBC_01796]|uniref:ABC transporter substrate-binding protein n=1 Tax=Micromonospora sp. NBC_01796 TaxID=2975987 RepID=UPI002DD8E3C4|nr:extracellular solute-binding protein [Micromonospora sp. NBC_01796]WSA85508.1 extracellular solute-binding protein [Micromonospora sp. NBC_01796]